MATNAKHFNKICEAFEVLSNPEFKSVYDAYGEQVLKEGFEPEAKQDLRGVQYRWKGDGNKIFEGFFGSTNPFSDEFKETGEDMFGRML